MTKVKFLVNEANPLNKDLFVFFPEEKHNKLFLIGFSHIGQHSAVHPEYAKESRLAKFEEYKGLKTALEQLGYKLDVLNKD